MFSTTKRMFIMKEIKLKSGELLQLQEPSIKDAAAMISYVKKVGDETDNLTFDGADFNITVEQEEAIILKHQTENNHLILLAKINTEIVGMLNISGSHRKRCKHIGEFGISILKKHWGKQIGTIMLNEMITWAKNGGLVTKINLSVLQQNDRAVKLYERLGFKHEGVRTRASYQGGKYLDTYLMGIEID